MSALVAAAAGIALIRRGGSERTWGRALLLAAAGLTVSLSVVVPRLPAGSGPPALPRPGRPHLGLPERQVEVFAGTLQEDSTVGPEGTAFFRLRLQRVWAAGGERAASASGVVRVAAAGDLRLYWGQEVRVRGGLSRASSPGAAAFLSRARAVEAGWIPAAALRARAAALAAVEAAVDRLDPAAAALLAALLLGRRGEVPAALYEEFRASGTLHLLALSGLHVGMVFAAFWALLLWVPGRTPRRLLAGAGVLGYLLLVGLRPSLLRAVVMLLGAGIGQALDREADPLNLLSLAAAVVLLLDPWHYADLGCQLSFLSLAGICLLSPGLSRLLARWLPGWLRLPLAVAAGAQLGSLPLLALRFGAVAPAGILASAVLVPLVSLFLWAGLAAIPLALAGGWLLAAADRLLRGLHALLRLCLGIFSAIPQVAVLWRPWHWAAFAALLAVAAAGLPLRGVRAGVGPALPEAGA